MINLMLGVVCVSLSLPFGILLALGRQSDMPIIKWISVVFIEFIRGVPLITLLFVANVVLAYFLPPGTNFDLILRVIIMITMFASAYIAEVIRGGLAALPRGQYEAADSLGLDYAQAMQFIILPQALKISIPGIVNVSVGLFKDTTLVSVISMFDIVGMIRGPILASSEWNGVYWELFGFAACSFSSPATASRNIRNGWSGSFRPIITEKDQDMAADESQPNLKRRWRSPTRLPSRSSR